jgi:predicted RNA-binding Zn-ribbon protein involved in translation (DUF1610 family)
MPLRNCPRCGASLTFIERTNKATPNDHHNDVYECPNCGRTVISG